MGFPQYDSLYMTLPAGATAAAYLRVKLDSAGLVQIAAATEVSIGYLMETGMTSGQNCVVRLHGLPLNAVALTAIVVGSKCFAQAGGKVDDVDSAPGTTYMVGTALTAASANNDIVTILRPDYIS